MSEPTETPKKKNNWEQASLTERSTASQSPAPCPGCTIGLHSGKPAEAARCSIRCRAQVAVKQRVLKTTFGTWAR